LPGGDRETTARIFFPGVDVSEGTSKTQEIDTLLFEADIQQDIILSYPWMEKYNVKVNARRHGVYIPSPEGTLDDEFEVWVSGIMEGCPHRTSLIHQIGKKSISLQTMERKIPMDWRGIHIPTGIF
jgi:hypothetical protein